MDEPTPHLVVLSSLFPHSGRPQAGLFIRERMFRVAKHLPVTVVSPQPWVPGQRLIRRFRPHFRPPAPRRENQDGVEVMLPRFLSLPSIAKSWDGLSMACAAFPTLRRLMRRGRLDIIDAHFAYPDGYAASLLSKWLDVPYTITLRGTEPRHSRNPVLRRRLVRALMGAAKIFTVSASLAQLARELGAPEERVQVIGNGVDITRFQPVDRSAARRELGLSEDAQILISVGALVPRKGFQRVIDCLPALLRKHPKLIYLVVGGPSPEGNNHRELEQQVNRLVLSDHVRFLGSLPPERLKWPLSAADLFVLATANEGWANVFLEAMACGLPVISTDVGGNREVICRDQLGSIVPFGDQAALTDAIDAGLSHDWDRAAIIAHARANQWDRRVSELVTAFGAVR